MKNKLVLVLVCVAIALLGVMLLHSRRPSTDSARTPSDSGSPATTSAPNGSTNQIQASTPRPPADPRMVIKAKFNTGPIKPEELERLQMGMEERRELDFSQVQTAFKLLREVDPRDDSPLGHVRKNELMNALNRQSTLPGVIVDLYATIYRDPAQNEVIRDYAIQHVYEAYPKLTAAKLKGDAISLLREAADESASSTAGTAILALARLAQSNASLAKDEIVTTAFDLASNPSANPSARISALQVIGQLDAQAAVPLLVQTVQNGESVPMQLSAIGALGLVGGRTEIELLNGIAGGGNTRLKPAALTALERIRERTGTR